VAATEGFSYALSARKDGIRGSVGVYCGRARDQMEILAKEHRLLKGEHSGEHL
jgi:hypothetical protein